MILRIFFGSKYERDIKKMQPIVSKVNQFKEEIGNLSDADLQAKTIQFKERISRGESLDEILPEAFACVRSASEKTIGLSHYDVQIMGGIVLHRGMISEMKTGEGKTLTSTLPIYLNALVGNGVHLVTVNDYLAKRDAEWMKPIYNFLGLSVGFITSNMPHEQRKSAYSKDITYGTNNEFGFDYLRDNMVEHKTLKVQRGHQYAIVDEVDSILIDEARTPLIISGPAEQSTDVYPRVDKIVHQLRDKDDYEVDEKARNVLLTEIGVAKVEKLLEIGNLYDPGNVDLVHHVHQSLKAYALFQKDVDYVIQGGEIIIVDEFTGRLMEGRRYSDGLHQAIEAKEKVPIKQENQTLATITFQNYFRLYKKLAGMTGTADTEAEEFRKIYGLEVSVLPTHMPMIRLDYPDQIYRTQKEKFEAIAEDVKEKYLKGQPILLGTVSIENSEKLSKLLTQKGVPHSILNAKFHEKEAEIIKEAGQRSKVTIATNMAGRGTDIVLGDTVKSVGGLHIIGSERHESRRIDNQLRGRSGRQGDSGSSRFYLSLEDDLMRIFGSDRIGPIMQKLGMEDGEAIEHKMVTNAIERAQKKVEGHNFDIRKHLLEYDDVMDTQRNYVYKIRNEALDKEDVSELISGFLSDAIRTKLEEFLPPKDYNAWNVEGLSNWLQKNFEIHLSSLGDNIDEMHFDDILSKVMSLVQQKYDQKKEQIGEENFSILQRIVLLKVIDQKWKDHLYAIDQLREGIWTIGYAQRTPIVEYRFQSFSLFEEMNSMVKEEVVEYIFRAQIQERLQEDVPAEYEMQGVAKHSNTESYGVGSALKNFNQNKDGRGLLDATSPNVEHGSGMSKAALKAGGGISRRKSRKRRR